MLDLEVDRTLGRDMLDVLREVRLIRLRNGAFSWRLYEDLGRPNTYRVELMYPSWTEFLLTEERMTKNERRDRRKGSRISCWREAGGVQALFVCESRVTRSAPPGHARPREMHDALMTFSGRESAT